MIRSELVQKLCEDFPDLTQREIELVVTALFDSITEPLAHFLARLEIGHALGLHVDGFPGARIAADAGVALARRKGPEPAQFHAAAVGELLGDAVE